MLQFITDQREGEPDILTSLVNEKLVIRSLDGEHHLTYEAPPSGWTHDSLQEISLVLPEIVDEAGANAFLAEVWVGSTEV